MEGLLSKWTNVMKGWQFRWFVLDENTGLLSYYTSKEKMRRGVRRGCIRLQGAVLGIDDEEDANFTITVDAKVFHLQAKDAEEREVWVRALEDAILKHARIRPGSYLPLHLSSYNVTGAYGTSAGYAGGTGGGGVGGTEGNLLEPMAIFEQRLAQADSYLQMLIQQLGALEGKPELSHVLAKANEFLEAVKHSIVLLQIAKNTAFPVTGLTAPVVLHYSDPEIQTGIEFGSEPSSAASSTTAVGGVGAIQAGNVNKVITGIGSGSVSSTPIVSPTGASVSAASRILSSAGSLSSVVGQSPISPNEKKNPVFISYSSSDDEQDFYDASEDFDAEVSGPKLLAKQSSASFEDKAAAYMGTVGVKEPGSRSSSIQGAETPTSDEQRQQQSTPTSDRAPGSPGSGSTSSNSGIDYDALYDEDLPEDDLGSVESHGSVLSHLLSQVKIGMDLTKVVLPTFILERRSLLEMYADFFAHPDMFVAVADTQTPKDRMVAVLRWYLGAFHAGRRSEVAKKPYNPILGEIFQCYWHMPHKTGGGGKGASISGGGGSKDGESTTAAATAENNYSNGSNNNPNSTLFPWVEDPDALVFFAEQVSHHPPISAFYAEHVKKQITLNAHIWTKSKFLGLSIGVHNIGHAMLTVHSPSREDYVLGFPNGYARSIFSVPWVELGGPVTISCSQTGYNARVEFLTKPFFGGDRNKISAQVFSPEDKRKPFLTVEGEWNGLMVGKWADGRTEKFVDVRTLEIIKKRTKPVAQQEPNESRRMWKDVTAGLKFKDIEKATDAKFFLEQRQRNEAQERREKGEAWKPRMFIPAGDTWIFSEPLEQRLKAHRKLTASTSGPPS